MIKLLVEPNAHSGSWNMAVDESLLELALESEQCTVRIYSWETATVSLGYFQSSADFRSSNRFQDLPAVRRLTGGGAILHDRELTYSLALPSTHPLSADPTRLYETVHSAIIQLLASMGVQAAMRGTDESRSDEPFLCFVRGDRHDILCHGSKVVGSAQRRRRGAVLQHGSLIVQASPHANEIPGICDLADPSEELQLPSDFAGSLGQAIAQTLGTVTQLDRWPDEQEGRVRLLEERYRKIKWSRPARSALK
jgi:lipoate-protein ligase A